MLRQSDAVPLSNQALSEIVGEMHQLADAAGAVILQHFRRDLEVDNKAGPGDFDPVTVADRAAERAIRAVLAERRPQDGILGEEEGYQQGSSGLTWIIDPIDGTRAFISGLPIWGTLVALHDGQKSVVGMMDQPYLQERYFGSKLGSRFLKVGCDPVSMTVKPRSGLSAAVLASTSPDVFSENEASRFQHVAKSVATVRYGTDCYGYAMLAAGNVDLVIEAGLQAYDIQPLIPVIEGAGGFVSNWCGEPVRAGGQILAAASKPLLHAALELLNAKN